jgi:excisionase family DNA binding protein
MRRSVNHEGKPAALSVDETCWEGGFGRETFYKAVREGRLKVRKLGARTLVLRADLLEFLNSLPIVNEQ